MNLISQVYSTLKWKKSDAFCADKLGISLEEYKSIKNKVKKFDNNIEESVNKLNEFKEDIEKGVAEFKGISISEPKSAEEIIRILKIDTTKWKLSSYWNKESSKGWLISAQVTSIKSTPKVDIKNILDECKFKYTPITTTHINNKFSERTCVVLSLQDIHIGKEILDKTGTSIEDSVKNCISNLILRSYHSNQIDKIVFVLGGDLINMDTYLGTTTAGTLVQNSVPAYDAYKIAFELMFWSVNYLKQFCNNLEVVYIPGNHSRLSEAHIAYALSKSIVDPHITWNIEYAERKVITYGNSFLAFEHGDFDTRKSFFAFATEFPKQWGNSIYRTLYTGHYHKEKKIEYITTDEVNGFTIKILPSLSKVDQFHSSGKWTNNKRGGLVELHSFTNGPTGTLSYYEQ